MKKILLSFLLLFLAFVAQAQDTKPTKEQTIEYIINKLQDYGWDNEYDQSGYFIHVKHSIKEITFKDNNLYVKTYHYGSMTDRATSEYLQEYYINLKEVEKVVQTKSEKGGWFLSLSSVNSKKNIKYIKTNVSPTTTTDNQNVSEVSIPSPDDDKLVKAFNHLRKLCGAPEPIKF